MSRACDDRLALKGRIGMETADAVWIALAGVLAAKARGGAKVTTSTLVLWPAPLIGRAGLGAGVGASQGLRFGLSTVAHPHTCLHTAKLHMLTGFCSKEHHP